jgi:hypothetical protein
VRASSFLSIQVKDFFHIRPPLAGRAGGYGILHGLHHVPPLLGQGIVTHLLHVAVKIRSDILEIGEQEAVLEEYGIVADIAFGNLCEDSSSFSLLTRMTCP